MSTPTRNRSDGLIEMDATPQQIFDLTFASTVYTVEGALIALCSFPIVIVVVLFPSLRAQKEYVIYAALSFAHGLSGLAYLTSGIYKLVLQAKGDAFILVSRWDCFILTPMNIMFVYSGPLATIMELVLTIDRLIAISSPIRYYSFTNRYAFRLVGAVYAYQVIPLLVCAYMTSKMRVADKPAYCYVSMATTTDYYKYYYLLIKIITAVSSVLLYIPVAIKIRRVSCYAI
uniref:G-protein coupled receptors family 1 profile domain-containing protein n=1 Tax=Plectus sambesii TaxID=2011161 RepID=A0A914WMY3_9BILA